MASRNSPALTSSTVCVPLSQGHLDYPWVSVPLGETLQAADIAEHSEAAAGSSQGSGTKESEQRKEG